MTLDTPPSVAEEPVEVLDDRRPQVLPETPPSPDLPRAPSPSPAKGVEVSPLRYGLAVATAATRVPHRTPPPAIVLSSSDWDSDKENERPLSDDDDEEPLGSLPSFLKRSSFASSSGDDSTGAFSLRPASRNSSDSHSSGRPRPDSVSSLTSVGFQTMLYSSGLSEFFRHGISTDSDALFSLEPGGYNRLVRFDRQWRRRLPSPEPASFDSATAHAVD